MAEVLVQFDTVLTSPDGQRFAPQACGRPAGNVWEGWIERCGSGEDILARELSALDTAHLRDIVLAYGFSSPERARSATRDQLTAIILAAVHGASISGDETSGRGRAHS